MMVCLLEFHSVPAYHLLGGFINVEPAVNPQYTPWQMDKNSDQEGGCHNLIASLEEHYATSSKSKVTNHIGEDDCRNERPLDPVIVSSIENITAHIYPFWRVHCKVTDWCFAVSLIV